ncbi:MULTISPECIES: nickel ABC transporter substrate-binding protein [unclassified Granulicatella]|uniref:nickel ABC transporter substrate-binding protein n=1 Tax=unclassified Granulicatella TaxID=2630493 RepID=UPI0010739AA9|nr:MULTISPECIES: nickel ABC transporter substrate-binding protein [unclassified Granulicatella]MBF0779539.1 nickel ABC transporter, nickel/metallophore periplasmic binding protein [Granulicatella sp. 19428wC4_WM01]TFU96504.1 nickel ABC transporter, nickel/metallophore periplasmic binding protein [Granulicatella sp. WM01]
MKTKKLLLGALSALFVLASCQAPQNTSEKSTSQSDAKERLVMAWGEDVAEINPHLYNPDQFITQDMVYEGLVRYGDNGVIEPALAESWTLSEDGTVYTFKLRKTNFSDGTPFNAENVKRNFDVIFSEKTKAEHKWFDFTNRMVSYRVVDEYTFEITLDKAYSATLYDLAMIRPIRFLGNAGFPEGDDTSKGIKAPIGTGAWVLKEKKANEYATFIRNENYWGEKPKLKEVTIRIIPDGQTRALEFEAGKLDMIYGNGLISLDTFETYKNNPAYTTAVSQPMSSRLLLLNASKTQFSDKNVRKALNYAMNKQEISNGIFKGAETPASTIFSKSTPYSDAGVEPYQYDLAKAEKLLDEAGWVKGSDGIRVKDGQKLVVYMPYIATKVQDKEIGEYLQGEWKKLGLDVMLQAYEEDDYWSNAKTGNFDVMLTYSWGAPWDPHAWMTALTEQSAHGHPENVSLESLAVKPELDELIKKTLVAKTKEETAAGYKKALQILHEEAIYIPLTYQSLISVYRTGELDGVRFMPQENELPLRYINKLK